MSTLETKQNNHFFKLNRAIVQKGYWKTLPRYSRCIFPVIITHINHKNNSTFIGNDRISELARVDKKYMDSAISGLKRLSGFSISFDTSKRGKKMQIFNYESGKLEDVRFFKEIILNGTWAKLSSSAKSLYVTMLCFTYQEYPENHCFSTEEKEVFIAREGEGICIADKDVLWEKAGIGRRSYFNAIKELKEIGLIRVTKKVDEYLVLWTVDKLN